LYPNATIYATARDPTKATELQTLAEGSKKIVIIKADAKDGHSIQHVAEKVSEFSYSVDHVIYNAGVLSGWGSLLEAGIDGLKDNMDINVYGAYYTALYFTPLLLKSKYEKKSLVFLSSNFASLTLADEIYASHVKLFGTPGHDPTALYNISKVSSPNLRELLI
jgi:NADP-dependent 3-hydroxy acid dehydrogenase YdfG